MGEAMRGVVVIFAALIAGVGILGVYQPAPLMRGVARIWRNPAVLWLGVGLRVVLGVALLVTAGGSSFPQAFRILALLSFLTALSFPLLGYERMLGWIRWWTTRPPGFVRAWCLVALAFGLFLLYGVL